MPGGGRAGGGGGRSGEFLHIFIVYE